MICSAAMRRRLAELPRIAAFLVLRQPAVGELEHGLVDLDRASKFFFGTTSPVTGDGVYVFLLTGFLRINPVTGDGVSRSVTVRVTTAVSTSHLDESGK